MKEVTSVSDLIEKSSLYESLKITDGNLLSIFNSIISTYGTQFDCYCVECAKESTFKLVFSEFKGHPNINLPSKSPRDIQEIIASASKPKQLIFQCQRAAIHEISIILKCKDLDIFKIGQYPALAEIEKHDIEKYKKLLKKDYVNLNKAIGLRSHGIGAGSYVYLRRIFENLIEEKHLEAQTESSWDETKYNQSRMKEKIKLLEHKLPNILVETPELYGILSKGIHELSEEECLKYFPVTKYAIELILEEKLALLEKEVKTKELKASLGTIASTILK